MRPIRISENIVSVSDFKAKAAEMLRSISTSSEPTVITQNGRPAAVVLSPATYDELVEHFRFVSSVNEGLADVESGRSNSHEDVVAELERRFGTSDTDE